MEKKLEDKFRGKKVGQVRIVDILRTMRLKVKCKKAAKGKQ